MGRRFAMLIGAAALGAAVIAAGASADFRSVGDRRGDTRCFHEHSDQHRPCTDSVRRNADIVRATAGHDGQWLKHTIRVDGKFDYGVIGIWTDAYPRCGLYVSIHRGADKPKVRECFTARITGRARFHFHRHSVEVFFKERSIGNPRSYDWRAGAGAGPGNGHATDYAPGRTDRITHRLGDSGTAAAGVMALGAQKAVAPVRKYDTELTIRKEHGSFLGTVWSERVPISVPDRANLVRKCMNRRRVILFKQRPGADRKLGADRSSRGNPTIRSTRSGDWQVSVPKGTLRHGDHVYAKVRPKVRNRYVCRADHAAFSP